jgi:DNA-binding NtrC family response regulator
MRILLITDNDDLRSEVTHALRFEFSNARIELIRDEAAFDAVEEFDGFDLAVIDWELGWSAGHDIAGTITSVDPNCPVIALANDPAAACEEATQAGAHRCLAKSDMRMLREAAARDLERRTQRTHPVAAK